MLNTVLGSLSSGVAASTSSYESIATITGNGSSDTLTLSSIPSTYTHLQLRCFANSPLGGGAIIMTFNSDTGSNYSYHRLQGTGSAVAAAGVGSNTAIAFATYAVDTSNIYGVGIIDIHDYKDTTKYKTSRTFMGYDINGGGLALLGSGSWRNTAAITSITFSNPGAPFTSASTFALYGIKGA